MGLFFNDLRAQFRAKPDGGATLGQYIPEEVRRLESYLYDHEANKQRIIENVTDDLLTGYYETRTSLTKIKNDKKKRAAAAKAGAAAPSPEADEKELRAVMLTYHDVAAMVMVDICRRVGGSYSDEFIRRWEEKTSRTGYFPFGALMRTNARATPSPTDNAQPEQPEAPTKQRKEKKILSERIRIAAVYKLMEQQGATLAKYDRTVIAKFIRDIIGGNPNVIIKNTNVYKALPVELTPEEEKNIAELFKPFK